MQFTMILFSLSDTFTTEPYSLVTYVLLLDRKKVGSYPISEHAIQNSYDQAVKKSGVKRIRIHDLRNNFVSRLIHLGASPYVVANLIGYNVEQIYKIYGHLYEKDKLDILKKL